MSRHLAPLALAAVALLSIPRPPEPPPASPVLAPTSKVEDEWETEVPYPGAHDGCKPEPERLEEAKVARAIEADHIGAPTVELIAGKSGEGIDLRLFPFYVEPPPEERENCTMCPPPPSLPSPSRFPGRGGATKSKLIRENGGSADSERAVAVGLAWLAKQQKVDGGWEFDAGGWKDDRVAATGLALLPLLGAGATHKPGGDFTLSKFRGVVNTALAFLVKNCPPNGPNAGAMSADPTAQAIATTALCEAFGMTKDVDLLPHAQAALNRLQRMQRPDGGWGDISTTGWAAQALLAAKTARDLVVVDRVLKLAVAYLNATDAGPGTTAAAVVHFGKYHLGDWGPNNPGFVDGASGLLKQPPERDPVRRYYASWVLLRREGEEWKTWNEGSKGPDGVRRGGARDPLAVAQLRRDGADYGSWAAEGEWGERCGRLGTTALNLLTLEVYYRYLPLYKRGAGGEAVKILEEK